MRHRHGKKWNRKHKHHPRLRKQIILSLRRAVADLTEHDVLRYMSGHKVSVWADIVPKMLVYLRVLFHLPRPITIHDLDRAMYSIHRDFVMRALRLKYYW